MNSRHLKRTLATLATGLALLGASAAHAGYWGTVYHPTCGWVNGFYGPYFTCG